MAVDNRLLLSLILLVAVIVRSFDALNHASLGQSDAYAHLQFLRDVIHSGQIRNIVYPPGYSWVLALPAMTFNLDAYLVARYVGPFLGVLMVATLYLIGRRHTLTTGLLAAFLAAACPLFYPLIKTGMGAFANQLGLFLFPLALLLYLSRAPFLFAVILLGLTVSVPLFVFTLALILLVHRLLHCSGGKWWRESILLLLPFLVALMMAGYQFISPGMVHVAATATMVTGLESSAPKFITATNQTPTLFMRIKNHPIGKFPVDLLTVKRLGLGDPLLNLVTLSVAAMFAGILIAGFRGSKLCAGEEAQRSLSPSFLKLVGGWGLLTTLQAATGFLEFRFYQRSGWILLQAIALAGGIVIATLIQLEKAGKFFRPLTGLFLAACLIMAFWAPPQHRCILSGAENELVTVLREISAERLSSLGKNAPLAFERQTPSPLIVRAAAAPDLTLITRRYTLSSGDQGCIATVIPDSKAGIRYLGVGEGTRLAVPSRNFICLVDRFAGLPDMGIQERISPELTRMLTGFQVKLYKPNEVILAFLATLPTDTWRITQEDRGQNLSIYFVERR